MKVRLSKSCGKRAGGVRDAGARRAWCTRGERIARRTGALGGAIVSTFALLLAVAEPAFAQSASGTSRAVNNAPRSVTLITGDQVLLSGADLRGVGVRRAPGREGVRFTTSRVETGGRLHLFVVPEDAAPLIAAGKVDRRLFDVTLLVEYEYDDAHRNDLPLIVTYERSGSAVASAARVVPGAIAGRSLTSVNGLAVVSPKARVQEVWGSVLASRSAGAAQLTGNEPIGKLWLDGLLRPVLDRSVEQIGAPAAWALGYEGDGVLVSVLDTGVDDTHPDLIDTVIVRRNFTVDPDDDEVGHGTHVASILAGSGAAEDGRYRGVAPGVQLLAGKVCEGFGCPESSIIAGMQWAVAEEGARVVNLSLGGGDTPGYDPLEEAVSTLTAQYGALFVIAAGNSGPENTTIESPGAIAAALTVGAVDRDEQVAIFSSRGLTLEGLLKPDLTAPGVDIVAARAAGTELGELVGEDYVMASGTSMATPHVAGAVALLLEQHPTWGPAELKSALVGSAAFNPALTALEQGGGRVDVAAALDTSLLASTPNLSFGVARWPHEDDEPTARTVSYRNLGAATELALALDVRGPDGVAAPEGMFRVEPATLALAEGGTASVRVTADTRAGNVDGVFGGRLLASDASGRTLAVPFAVEREVESYNLELQYIDRQGQPAGSFSTLLLGFDPFILAFISDPSEQTLRLPRGNYILETFIFDAVGDDAVTVLLAPNQPIEADTVLALDARTAAPVSVTLPNPSAEPTSATLSYDVSSGTGSLSSTIGMALGTPVYYGGMVGPAAPNLTASLQGVWQDLATTPPSIYTAGLAGHGRLPEGEVTVDLEQLAVVHARFAASLGDPLPLNDVYIAAFLDGSNGYGYSPIDVAFPHERTEYYYTADPALGWVSGFWAHDEDYLQNFFLDGVLSKLEAGRSYTARWNEPVFAAVLPEVTAFSDFARREGDVLSIFPPLYGDSHGHEGYLDTEGSTRLYRNGELLAETAAGTGGSFEVPPEPATYRLELEASQVQFELTTQQRLVYAFASAHVPDDESLRLPLLGVRFDAPLNASGRAPRGSFCLPLRVTRYGRGVVSDVGPLSLEVSYDDGATWSAAVVQRDGERLSALLDHPSGASYVSLRANVQDANGNAVEHTVIRAYALADAP